MAVGGGAVLLGKRSLVLRVPLQPASQVAAPIEATEMTSARHDLEAQAWRAFGRRPSTGIQLVSTAKGSQILQLAIRAYVDG
jgi:hypothetical protein